MKIPLNITLDLDEHWDGQSLSEILADEMLYQMKTSIRSLARDLMDEVSHDFKVKFAQHMQTRMDAIFEKLVENWDAQDDTWVEETMFGQIEGGDAV